MFYQRICQSFEAGFDVRTHFCRVCRAERPRVLRRLAASVVFASLPPSVSNTLARRAHCHTNTVWLNTSLSTSVRGTIHLPACQLSASIHLALSSPTMLLTKLCVALPTFLATLEFTLAPPNIRALRLVICTQLTAVILPNFLTVRVSTQ